MRDPSRHSRRTIARVLAGLPLVALTTAIGATSGSGASPAHADADQEWAAAPVRVRDLAPPAVTARAAAVVDYASGALLFDKYADQAHAPASLTKILTALVTLQTTDLTRRVIARFSPDELDPDSTMMGLRPGDEVTIEDLLYGLMLPSGNDAALVLARSVAGYEPAFVAMMNRAVTANGLQRTLFINSHGLDEPGHHTSAHDIAEIARLAMRDPRFRAIVGAPSWSVRGDRSYTFANRNPFLSRYRGADGVKIGFTDEAGQTIVASATRDGRRAIVALLGTRDRAGESAALMDWAFASYRWPDDPVAASTAGR
jgi:D-alanyl-D-alanine carboxypeptidase